MLSSSHGNLINYESEITSHENKGHGPSSTSSDQRFVVIPNKVPPPKGITLKTATRDNDGFFFKKKVDQDLHTSSDFSSADEEKSAVHGESMFSPRENSLKSHFVIKKQNLSMTDITKTKDCEVSKDLATRAERKPDIQSSTKLSSFLKNNNMKRSVRYKKITLREPEKPLYVHSNESDSEDDRELSMNSPINTCSSSAVPGPQAGVRFDMKAKKFVDTIDESYENLDATGEENIESESNGDAESTLLSSSSPSSLCSHKVVHHPVTTVHPHSNQWHSQANTYSRVMVMGTRDESECEHGCTPISHKLSNDQHCNVLIGKLSLEETEEEDSKDTDEDGKEETDKSTSFRSQEMYSPLRFVETEALVSPALLPAPANDLFMDFSQNSLDNILVDPPEMFCAETEQSSINPATAFVLGSPRAKRKLSRTSWNSTIGNTNDILSEPVPNNKGDSIPKYQQNVSDDIPDPTTDRNSTESNDTGYTSSTSPRYQNQINSQQHQQELKDQQSKKDFNDGVFPNGRSTPIPEEELRTGALKSRHSLISVSSDMARFYVPFVFHSKKVVKDTANMRVDSNMFCVQVCLVENSEDLIRVR